MLKKIFIISCIIFSTAVPAQQESGQYIHKHLVRTDASIISGYMFKGNIKNVYINGNLDYYLDNKISIRGDVNWMVGSSSTSENSIGLKDNHSVMLGVAYHFHTNGHLDPYFILQPGLAYTSSYQWKGDVPFPETNVYKVNYKGLVSPLGSAGLGFNYYFQRFAHLFLETRYVHGNHLSEAPKPISLQELRITFGLGFNLFIIKQPR